MDYLYVNYVHGEYTDNDIMIELYYIYYTKVNKLE